MRTSELDVEYIDYARTGLSEAVVKRIVKAAGSVAAVLNTRHATARERGWKDAPPSAAELARAAAQEPNLLRRPILLLGDRAIVGFDRDAYARL